MVNGPPYVAVHKDSKCPPQCTNPQGQSEGHTMTKTTANATVEKLMETGKERFEQAVKAGQDAATKNYEKAVELSKKSVDDTMKAMDETAVLAKGNVEAMIASAQAAAKGFETITKAMTDYSKKSLADSQATFKSLAAAKTAKEFFDIHNGAVKSSYDAFVAEASKMTELFVKVGNDSFAPLSNRAALAMEKMTKVAK
jgi:phasin family protein